MACGGCRKPAAQQQARAAEKQAVKEAVRAARIANQTATNQPAPVKSTQSTPK